MIRRLALVGLGVALVALPFTPHGARAAGTDTPGANLGGYKASSRAAGLEVLYNDGRYADLTLPFAETDAGTGVGHTLASDAYPGAVGGNPGATLQQFLGANVPPQVAQVLGTLSDPVKAEAYASGPNDASFPQNGPVQGLSNTAHVDPNAANLSAIGAYVQVGGINSRTQSTTTVGASIVTSTATSTISDVGLGDLVHIGRVESTATASSDGTTGSASGKTTIAALTVAGMTVGIDDKGITLGPVGLPIALGPMVNPILKALGVQISLSPPTHNVQGDLAVEHAPALTITIIPVKGGGNTFYVTVGGAEAEARATPSFADTTPPSVPSATQTPLPDTSSGTPSVVPTGDNSQTALAPVVTPQPSSGSGGGAQTVISAVPAVAGSKGIGAGLIVLGLLVGGAGAFGLGRIPDDVLAEKPAASICPLEGSDS